MTAVLSLTLAGAAHALSVDIVLPETDPAEVYPQVRVRFLAVAWDENGNEVTDRATFTWTFPDAKEPTVGNPVLHRFPEVGKFLVSVSATVNSDSGCDQTTVIVIPYEGGGLRQAPGVDDFTFTANGHESGAEVADHVGLLVEQVRDTYPFFWVGTEFQRYQNGQWVAPGDQMGWPQYDWFTLDDYPQRNGPVQWRARVMLDDIGADPPNGMDLYVPGTWTVVNTVVKSASPPLIIHHAEDTAHTIAWDLTHCEDFDPLFTMTVTIHDLAGNTVATLVRYDVPLEEQNPQIVWDANLPQEDGIYTYRICARHEHDTPLITCVDWDKSGALVLTLDGIDHYAWVCRHEGKHATDFTLWWPNGRPDPAQPDTDNDFLPDNDEANLGGTQQNPRNGGPFYVGPTDDSDDDGMRDIEDYTVNTQPPWTKGSADGEDWASPGKQSDL